MAEILPKSPDYYDTGSSGERRIYESLRDNLDINGYSFMKEIVEYCKK